MKKAMISVLGGTVLGIVLIVLSVYILSLPSLESGGNRPETESTGVNSENTMESDTNLDTDTESQLPTETESTETQQTETEILTESELPTESEEPTETEPSEESVVIPSKPKEIPYYIKVNRAANCVTIYTKDENGNYTVPYKSMICSVGTYYWDDSTQSLEGNTPLGIYKMPGNRYKWRLLFGPAGLDVYGYYTTRIVGHILFHSVPYTATSNDVLWEGQYNRLGSPASKGCIRLSVADAKWIYDNCGAGTIVEIYDDADNPGPLGRPEAIKIGEGSPYAGWDPTDPDPNNPWHTGVVSLNGVKAVSPIERGTTVDLNEYFVGDWVTATDVDTLSIAVNVSTDLDSSKTGEYTVVYTASGVTGKYATQTITVNVQDTTAPTITQKKTIAVTDNSIDIEQLIRNTLTITDNGDTLDNSVIQLDYSKLTEAMDSYSYANGIVCYASATDSYGNTIEKQPFYVNYKYETDKLSPEIELTGEKSSVQVDLTDILDEATRRQTITDKAISAVVRDKHYIVTDNVSNADEIDCAITGTYKGTTIEGVYTVELTITATDTTGNSSKKVIIVEVNIVDNTVIDDTGTDTDTETDSEIDTEIGTEPKETSGN